MTTITILGSGTCVPSLKRSPCSVLIETNGIRLLIDCGPGIMRRMLETGTEVFDISYLLLSHFHPDHCAELISFLFANNYPDKTRRILPLTLIAGNGLSNFFNGLKEVFGHWIELAPGMMNLMELDTRIIDFRQFESFTLESVSVDHNPESLAYRITTDRGVSVVYSGDTDVSDNLVHLAASADILICECALPDALKVRGHLTPSLAGTIAARAQVRKLVLTHFYPECDQTDIEAECRKTYSGELILAQDLMVIPIPS